MPGHWSCGQCARVCVNTALWSCPSCKTPRVPLKTCRFCGKENYNPKASACFYCKASYRRAPAVPVARVGALSRVQGPGRDWKDPPKTPAVFTGAKKSNTYNQSSLAVSTGAKESDSQDEGVPKAAAVSTGTKKSDSQDQRLPKAPVSTDANTSESQEKNEAVTSLPLFDAKAEFGLRERLLGAGKENFGYIAAQGTGSILELLDCQLILKGGATHSTAVEEAEDLIETLRVEYKQWTETLMKEGAEDAESTVSTADTPAAEISHADDSISLVSFLARVGSEYDATFVSKYSGAEDYADLIAFTWDVTDLDPLVHAGMKPLLRNKLYIAIQEERLGW